MKDKPRFIVKMMTTRLICTCFSTFLVKWLSNMKNKSVAKSSKELRLNTLIAPRMSTTKQDMKSSRKMYSVMKRCWAEQNGRRRFSRRLTGSSMLRVLETSLVTQTIKAKSKRRKRKKSKNRKNKKKLWENLKLSQCSWLLRGLRVKLMSKKIAVVRVKIEIYVRL